MSDDPPTVIPTDTGLWMHSKTSDYVFAWSECEKGSDDYKKLGRAFQVGKKVAIMVNEGVRKLGDDKFDNGLYLLDKDKMVEVLNGLDGFGQTSHQVQKKSGEGTSVAIKKEFFESVFSGLNGDISPLEEFLSEKMGDFQAAVESHQKSDQVGAIFVLVSLDPFEEPEFNVKYVHLEESNKEWFVKVACFKIERQSYSYSYAVVDYEYIPPEMAANRKQKHSK